MRHPASLNVFNNQTEESMYIVIKLKKWSFWIHKCYYSYNIKTTLIRGSFLPFSVNPASQCFKCKHIICLCYDCIYKDFRPFIKFLSVDSYYDG